MERAFLRIHEANNPQYPTTIYYAFKQSESEADDDDAQDVEASARSSTGWESFLQGLSDAGWQIDGTWPIPTEFGIADW